MARPGYNDDDSLNVSRGYTPRNTGNNSGGGNQGNQQSRDRTANELDQMINRSNQSTNNESNFLNNTISQNPTVTFQQQNDNRAKIAYQESLDRQAEMHKAMEMAYGMQGTEGNMKEVSQFHTLSDSQKQFLIDSGFAAAESSGILGGTMGAELEANKAKKLFSETGDPLQLLALGYDPKLLEPGGQLDPWVKDKDGNWVENTNYNSDLGYDPSAVYSWDDVESDKGLYNAFNDMQSSNLTPNNYTNYMNKISAFGHQAPNRSGDSSSGAVTTGVGGGSDSGGGGGGSRGGGINGQPNEQWAGMNPLQQAMISGHGGSNFQQGYARGGLVSLVC